MPTDKKSKTKTLGTFYQNPYFDDVLLLHQSDFPIPTKQTKNKSKIKEFKKRVTDLISNNKTGKWPRKGRLLVRVSIDCPKSYIKKVDVDNFLKLMFDLLKGYVYLDDSQIYYVLADKSIHLDNMIGFVVGIRELEQDEEPVFGWPAFYRSNPKAWKKERELKFGRK